MLLLTGCTTPQDPVLEFDRGHYAAALTGFRERAGNGDATAQNYLGIYYYLGLGVARDFSQAAHWFEQSALQADADAQRNLGVMYLRGLGVAQNKIRAWGWFHEAYVNGNRVAGQFLVQMTNMVTPNQTMTAREWVAARLAGSREPPANRDTNCCESGY